MNKEKIKMALEALNDGWKGTATGILKDLLNSESVETKEPETTEENVIPKKLFLVDVISLDKLRYAVEANSQEDAVEEILCNLHSTKLKSFSHTHLTNTISSVVEYTPEEYLKSFNHENENFKDVDASVKFSYINRSE
jgi:hypothetical protein